MSPSSDMSMVDDFLFGLATSSIESFLKQVMRNPVLGVQLAALEATPENVAAFARMHGYSFSADELDAYVEDRLLARLSAEEYAARERHLAAMAAGDIPDPPQRDSATPIRFMEIKAGDAFDRRPVLEGGVLALRGLPEIAALVSLLDVVEITYDPKKVSYEELLDVFWHSVDPTDAGGQFCDRGHSYMTAIYATSQEQLDAALASKAALEKSGALKASIVTDIAMAGPFWPAEEYHQDYYTKSPVKYRFYRWNCGRDRRVEELWGADAHKGIVKE